MLIRTTTTLLDDAEITSGWEESVDVSGCLAVTLKVLATGSIFDSIYVKFADGGTFASPTNVDGEYTLMFEGQNGYNNYFLDPTGKQQMIVAFPASLVGTTGITVKVEKVEA